MRLSETKRSARHAVYPERATTPLPTLGLRGEAGSRRAGHETIRDDGGVRRQSVAPPWPGARRRPLVRRAARHRGGGRARRVPGPTSRSCARAGGARPPGQRGRRLARARGAPRVHSPAMPTRAARIPLRCSVPRRARRRASSPLPPSLRVEQTTPQADRPRGPRADGMLRASRPNRSSWSPSPPPPAARGSAIALLVADRPEVPLRIAAPTRAAAGRWSRSPRPRPAGRRRETRALGRGRTRSPELLPRLGALVEVRNLARYFTRPVSSGTPWRPRPDPSCRGRRAR